MYSGKAGLGPELTLVEFVSTSAAFHGVTSQPLATLEAELLKVVLMFLFLLLSIFSFCYSFRHILLFLSYPCLLHEFMSFP